MRVLLVRDFSDLAESGFKQVRLKGTQPLFGLRDQLDLGSRDTANGDMLGHRWIALNYAEGPVRVGVQSAIPHPETAALMRKLMAERGLPALPPITSSICTTQICKGDAK